MHCIRKLFLIGISIIIINNQPNIYCQSQPPTQIDIIFDASGSMWGQIEGENKITIAREVMVDLLNDFKMKRDIQLALRVYGHLNKRCDNSVLEVPMGLDNHSVIVDKIMNIQPLGKTPIAYSLLESINDFNSEFQGDKVIILVTDGIESCDGNTCESALELKKAGIITKIHVVGFGMKEDEIESLKCISEPFDGKILGASDAKELKEAFNKISDEISSDKNLEVLGLDINNNKVYMDVDIYKNGEKIKSSEGTTAQFYLGEGTYNIYAKSRGTDIIVEKKNVIIPAGEKTKISLVFAEGKVLLKSVNSAGNSIYAFYSFFNMEGQEVFSTQGSGLTAKIVIPGVYDIKAYEQDTYSTLWAKNVQVNAGETVEKVFSFAMGTINIMPLTKSGGLSSEYWWYEFYNTETDEKQKVSTAGVGIKEVEILPGNYLIKVIDGYNNEVKIINNIEVESGEEIKVKINL